jgi:hypothetical protein
MAVDRHLAIAHLAQRARVLAGHAHGVAPLLGKARLIKNEPAVPLGPQPAQDLDPRAIEPFFVPDHARQQVLQLLFGGARHDRGQGIAILAGVFRQQAAQIAGHGGAAALLSKVEVEVGQELGPLRRVFRQKCGHAKQEELP